MTSELTPEPLEALPMPAGAIELPDSGDGLSPRQMVVAALQQGMAERRLALPLGPQTALDEEGRLLSLNRFAVQLACCGISSDQIAIDSQPWHEAAMAPQLLLAALVDEENGVVSFPGVLTGPEFVELARRQARGSAPLLLDTDAFQGGLERLLTLVQLLEPQALARVSLAEGPEAAALPVVAIVDWLQGQVDGALQQLFGARWEPVTQGAFRGAVAPDFEAMALVAIPLGLDGSQLVCGRAAETCVERFVLQMVATGSEPARPTGLVLRLSGAMAGDLLPDGLQLHARQGSHEQRQVAQGSTSLELVFGAGTALIAVSLTYPGSSDLVLPPLQLPG
ncbi:MAG: hypothetical protein WCF98_03295 [Synechococcus sp. ELA057]